MMQYRKYGKTGNEVSAIGFGGMRFVDPGDLEKSAELMKAAYDMGINYFDTARLYGKSEEVFGIALKEMKKNRSKKPFYIASKTNSTTPAEARKDLETSLKCMGLEYIDYYHVWCVLTYEDYLNRKKNKILKEFEKFKSEGLVKNIVVSTHMTGPDVGRMLEDYPFEGVLLGYSVANFPYREKALETASELKRGVVVMNPLHGGLIPQNPDKFDFVKTKPGETVVEGALRFLLNDPRITVSLVGFCNENELRQAIKAVDEFENLSKQSIDKIKSHVQENFNEMCSCCCYCDKCPQLIPVPKLMDVYNIYSLKGDTEMMLQRLQYHWGIGLEDECLRKCTGCGICEAACTQKLPIRERIEFIRDEALKMAEKQKNEKGK